MRPKMAVVHINTCKENSVAPTAMIAQFVSEWIVNPTRRRHWIVLTKSRGFNTSNGIAIIEKYSL